jgi:hypothetical protein
MPAIICPFCQHQNKSGTRFCSNCGCSIHLTICPNPECGKISEVGAAKCAHCGQPFPNAGETADTAASNGDHKGDGASAMAESEKTRTTAWPLIMMAIVAGGLPLLWANRALLPTPETWKSSASEAAKPTQVVPPTLPLKAAPPPPALAPQVVSTDSVAATSPAAAVPSGDAASSKSSAGPDNAKSTAKEKKNPGAKAGNASRKTGKTPAPEQPPPCTEATVALGLCDAKRAGK